MISDYSFGKIIGSNVTWFQFTTAGQILKILCSQPNSIPGLVHGGVSPNAVSVSLVSLCGLVDTSVGGFPYLFAPLEPVVNC